MKSLSFGLAQLRAPLLWLLVVFLVLVGMANPAQAQTVTLTPSATSGDGSIATTLTWSTNPAAQSCTASGHASWTGSKAPSGSLTLPVISQSGSYPLTLTCAWPGNVTATVSWTRPTTNTDGSALALCASSTTTGPCLAQYQVYRGSTPAEVGSGEMTPVRDPAATSYTWPGLAIGQHCFAVEVVNGNGVPSVLSNITNPCKTISAPASVTRSVTITVNPKPSPPTGVTVN